MRVAYLNITDPSTQCPAGFKVETANDTRFCIRDTNSSGCHSMMFEAIGHPYSRVCGYVRGYAYHTPDAFHNEHNAHLNGTYVDGVSITYGTTPTHIWTYVAGYQENASPNNNCPCNTPPSGPTPPSYVGSDYYCEAGTLTYQAMPKWYTNDPLWDGMQCGGDEGPCCNHTGLPWFNKNILTATTAAINVRVCLSEAISNENIGIDYLTIFVK